jgi:hypothetical protein
MMKNSVDHHDAWVSNYWGSETVILRLPPKSGLPVDVDIELGMSPMGELLRIDKDLDRIGFSFHGSGGGCVIIGLLKARRYFQKIRQCWVCFQKNGVQAMGEGTWLLGASTATVPSNRQR